MRLFSIAGRWGAVAIAVLWGAHSCLAQQSQEHDLKLDLSPLLNLGHAFELTPASVDKEFSHEGFKENPFVRWDKNRTKAEFSVRPFANVEVELSMLDRKVMLSRAEVSFVEGKAKIFSLSSDQASEAALSFA